MWRIESTRADPFRQHDGVGSWGRLSCSLKEVAAAVATSVTTLIATARLWLLLPRPLLAVSPPPLLLPSSAAAALSADSPTAAAATWRQM